MDLDLELEAFDKWFESWRQQSWESQCLDRGPKANANWGMGKRNDMLCGWLARASDSASDRE